MGSDRVVRFLISVFLLGGGLYGGRLSDVVGAWAMLEWSHMFQSRGER